MSKETALTDRRIETANDLAQLTFDEDGLVPVVAQDAETGSVLMVAWANREALEETLATRIMHFWSRSRDSLWKKGETSGNTQSLVSMHADCDGDTLLARVHPVGPACHTGEPTCFGAGARQEERVETPSVLLELAALLAARNRARPEGSYTTRLLEDENLRLKKLGEELAELIAALARRDPRAAEEAADLVYHLMVALEGAGRSWSEVEEELARRRR